MSSVFQQTIVQIFATVNFLSGLKFMMFSCRLLNTINIPAIMTHLIVVILFMVLYSP